MKILYFDCFSGISGDMALAALIDAGADQKFVEKGIQQLLENDVDIEIKWSRVKKCGVSSLDFDFKALEPVKIDHTYASIVTLIKKAAFDAPIEQMILKVFEKIAVAEGEIHGIPTEKVHFHEVGALDSIVDIVGIVLALYSLKVDQVYASKISLGFGSVECQHGEYPVPAMATLELLKKVPVQGGNCEFELTTPTGAAIICSFVDTFLNGLPEMQVESIGYGAGKRDLKGKPNVLRIIVGEVSPSSLS